MKTKKLFLMAAMLLASMCASAQSGNNEPLKGDVNGDGKVDVADITAIVKIIMENGGGTAEGVTYYYYYAGWTLPTVDNVDEIINETYPEDYGVDNLNTAGKKTTSKTSMDYLSNTLYNANEKTYYYVLVPTGHAIYDSLNNNVSNSAFTSQGNITVGNQIHTIYKSTGTSRYINAIKIGICDAPTYYWYVGQTNPSTMTEISPIVTSYENGGGWYELGTTLPTSIDQLIKGGTAGNIWYTAVPADSHLVPGSSADPDTSVNTGPTKVFNGVTYQIYIYEGVTGTRGSFELNR
ncbi:MAG: hypothetical protein IJL35_08105 [Bacteroidaceae bacterium]|nr:hypothetical protein [Bacteroidaceae bacterium]